MVMRSSHLARIASNMAVKTMPISSVETVMAPKVVAALTLSHVASFVARDTFKYTQIVLCAIIVPRIIHASKLQGCVLRRAQ